MNKIFNLKEFYYKICNSNCLISRNVESVLYITERISAFESKIWKLIPPEIRAVKKKYVYDQQKTVLVVFAKNTFKTQTLYNLVLTEIYRNLILALLRFNIFLLF